MLSLALILPIGVQNAFILTQGTLQNRWVGSFPSVITASICDTLLITLAILGVSAVALHITWVRYVLGVIGVIFILYMGLSVWRDVKQEDNANTALTAWGASRQIRFATSISLLNPHALIDTLVVIGGSALVYTHWSIRIAFGVACIAVSWIWFFGLSFVGHIVGRVALRNSSLVLINRISAVMMWLSAIYLAYIIYSLK